MSRSPALAASSIADLYLDEQERVHLVADSPKLRFAVYSCALVLDGSTLYLRDGGRRRPSARSPLLKLVPEELAERLAGLGVERLNREVSTAPRWRKAVFPTSYFAGYCDRDLLGDVHGDFGVAAVQEDPHYPGWLTYLVVHVPSGFAVQSFSRQTWAKRAVERFYSSPNSAGAAPLSAAIDEQVSVQRAAA